MNRSFSKRTFRDGSLVDARHQVRKVYRVAEYARRSYQELLLARCKDAVVLEYGCGKGSSASMLARQHTKKVIGIDISEPLIKMAREEALNEGLSNVEFRVMDAEDMSFDDDTFDLICGTGILHHLNLGKALPELRRVLKPGRSCVFLEPMAYNPFISLFRLLTPQLRERDEHPLRISDLRLMKKTFERVNVQFFCLFSLLALPFLSTRYFPRILYALNELDKLTFKFLPMFRWLAWLALIVLE